MVQIRIMHSDPDRVRQVAELLLPLIAQSPDLILGDPQEVPNRKDGGLRVVAEVIPAQPGADPIRVRAERADSRPSPARRRLSSSRALPPARDT